MKQMLAIITLFLLGGPLISAAHPPRALQEQSLLALFKLNQQPRLTIFKLAQTLGTRARTAQDLPFVLETPDNAHPALSFAEEIASDAGAERAVLRLEGSLFGVACDIQLLTHPVILHDTARRKQFLEGTDAPFILMITSKARGRAFPLKQVESLLRRFDLSVFLGGQVSDCSATEKWCYRRKYFIAAGKNHLPGVLLLELADPLGEVGGIKLIRRKNEP
jgi:hypothetical protein